jgi:hypothetical protein
MREATSAHLSLLSVQAHDLEKQADALSNRAAAVRKAGQKFCSAIDAMVAEQSQLATALEIFCSGEDEESLRIGCPLIRRFVTFFSDIKQEQAALGKSLHAALVHAVDNELGKHYQAIKDGKKALLKAENSSDASKMKFRFTRSENTNVRPLRCVSSSDLR